MPFSHTTWMDQSLLCSWLRMSTHGRQKYWLCFVFTCLQWRHACGTDVTEHCLFHIHMSHKKRKALCGAETIQWLNMSRQSRDSLWVALLVSSPTKRAIYTSIHQQPVASMDIAKTQQSNKLFRSYRVGPCTPANPLHTLMTAEAPLGCRHTTKWCVGRWKAPSRALKVYKKGVIKVSEKAG